MHVPNPLGGYPLVLRDSSITDYRAGELLLDYRENRLYYINKKDKEKIDIANSIYKKITGLVNNTPIIITKESDDIPGDEEVIPNPEDRKYNAFYMNIYKKEEIEK